MNKRLELQARIDVKDTSDHMVVKIDFGMNPCTEWCLGLCLLKEKLIDSLIITFPSDSFEMELIRDDELWHYNVAQANYVENMLLVYLSLHLLEYWVHFFLQYYRDGVAEVDHIDVEMDPRHGDGRGVFLTFQVSNFLPPVSAEEARRKLGL
jgi:hypothetical protein